MQADSNPSHGIPEIGKEHCRISGNSPERNYYVEYL